MRIATVLIFTFGIAFAYGSKCGDISGSWQNELGSKMILDVDASSRISGEYYTAVESNPGAAQFVSNITGLFSKQSEGSLLAFSVHFNHGSSLTSWVGQCIVCGDKEVIYTTYTFRKYAPNHQEKWAAVAVNQNTFWRLGDKSENDLDGSVTTGFFRLSILSVVSTKHPGGLDLRGKWKSKNTEEIEISGTNDDVIEGTVNLHQSANHKGKLGTTNIIGKKDGNDMFTAVALMSTSNKRIRTWTGYIHGSSESIPHTLETSWLEHEFNPSCTAPRYSVRFGAQNFTHVDAGSENIVKKSETFLDKLRKFFSSMF